MGAASPEGSSVRLRVRVRGAVQGVGFRPHVYGLARRHRLAGFVLNDAEGVLVEVEGALAPAFVEALRRSPPPLARIDEVEVADIPAEGSEAFSIRHSLPGPTITRIVPDAATCAACLNDLFDPASRFYGYPFVTCTHCGPRLTITAGLPYDRATTSMARFPMCPACRADYEDPAGRRFHAEAIACPACGPQLSHSPAEIASALRAGMIVALKGIGGFHLLCDARDADAVSRLRARKKRDFKPFAVMVANAASLARVAEPTSMERALAAGPAAPIVLMRAKPGLPEAIAPRLGRVGVMLAYAPAHHLVFAALAGSGAGQAGWSERAVDAALVATSANPNGEPLVVDDDDARRRLGGIADLVVTHDRPILVRADDSVAAVIDGAPVFLRRARGFVPDPIPLHEDGPDTIAFGGHLKATVTVTRRREAFVSQHVGDLDRVETVRFQREAADHLLSLLGARPELAACDLHPDLQSTRLAEETGLPVMRTQHHAAHVAAVAAEHGCRGRVLGAALDGHGLGPGGAAWGGELLLLEGPRWTRLGHLAPLPLPGGDRAAREPWRMALGALHALGRLDGDACSRFEAYRAAPAVAAMLGRGTTPTTTSLGRLFDAASGLLGLRMVQDHEGQAAMELEALALEPRVLPAGFGISGGVLDFSPLLARLAEPCMKPDVGAALFHGTLAEGLAAWITNAAQSLGLDRVALGGGCLVNRVLAEALCAALRRDGIDPLLPRVLPPNDGGLSFGQAVMARRLAGATPRARIPE